MNTSPTTGQATLPTITMHDGHLVTTSLDVSAKFGKRHDDVLKAIRNLECSEEFNLRNFMEISYLDSMNRPQPMNMMPEGQKSKKAKPWGGEPPHTPPFF